MCYNKNLMKNRKIYFLLTCFLITLFCGLSYGSVQQSLRLSADDSQVQITGDILNSLSQGADPKQLSATAADMSTTLTPFVIIYDNNEKAVGSTVELDKKIPVPPSGAFKKTAKLNEARFTWEPKKGVREASIMVKYKNGYVLVGKSLKEVEYKIDKIFMLTIVAWVMGIGATSLAFFLTRPEKVAEVKIETKAPKKSSRKAKK